MIQNIHDTRARIFCCKTEHSRQYIVDTGGQNPPFNEKPLIIGYSFIFRIFVSPPKTPRPPSTSRPLSLSLIVFKYITSICIKPCYDRMMKAIKEWWF